MKRIALCLSGMAALAVLGVLAPAAAANRPRSAPETVASGNRPLCDQNGATCTEVFDSIGYEGAYTGHDEPSLLFYSSTPGSGNSNFYRLKLPSDPPVPPRQNGRGGTFNFQLRVAFWLGMALCDTESAPEYTKECTPDSDSNIFNSSDPSSPRYMGKHPGVAFMEMQFYPPGWVPWFAGTSCDAVRWCAALNVDSLSEDMNTGEVNNEECLDTVSIEPVNFAFITKSGRPHAAPDPVSFFTTADTGTVNPRTDLFMNSGDELLVGMYDTFEGFKVVINDTTSGEMGSMTASGRNGFGQIKFDPHGHGCTVIPYDFHPMYATSSPRTRVVWAAHSYNVAFSDEIGHWEYCSTVEGGPGGTCADDPNDPPEGDFGDDSYCFLPGTWPMGVPIGGCQGVDDDFDGVPYQKVWPGTAGPTTDQRLHPTSIEFTSPLFYNGVGLQDYDTAAFEADLPRIEGGTHPACNRQTGAHCVNPPKGANFYPIYTTAADANDNCVWHLGGVHIPGTTRVFGGNSHDEYGPLLRVTYPGVGFTTIQRYNDFRRILKRNPCPGPQAQSFAPVLGG